MLDYTIFITAFQIDLRQVSQTYGTDKEDGYETRT